jgi:hypothetical protein
MNDEEGCITFIFVILIVIFLTTIAVNSFTSKNWEDYLVENGYAKYILEGKNSNGN